MSDDTSIDTGAEVAVPDGEVTHEQLVKILTDAQSAEPEEGDAPAAAPEPVAPAKPAEPSVSARILANRRAEMRAAQERASIAADRAAVAKEREQAAEFTKVAEQVKAAKMSPSKALELLGMTPAQFLQTLAEENEPEAVAKRVMSTSEAETQRLSEEVKALRAERERERFETQQAQYQREVHSLQKAFVDEVVASDAYPHLVSEYPADEIAKAGWQLAADFADKFRKREGRAPTEDETPSNEDIAAYLERQAAARAEKRAAWHAQIGRNVPNPSQGTAANQGQPPKATTPRTLTNGLSSQKATPTKTWTQQDADAESKRILQQMYAEASDD